MAASTSVSGNARPAAYRRSNPVIEFCHFIAGEIEMTHADGRKERLGPGDAISLPLGWKGEWRVIKQVRKLYIITKG